MTFRSFRFTSKNNEKCSKISLNTSPNPLKIGPELLPKRHSKKQQEKTPQNRQKVKICSPTGSLGGGRQVRFRVFFVSGRPLEPKWSQDLPQEPPGPPRASLFHDFRSILDAVFGSCCCFVGLFSLSLVERRTKNKERSRHGGGDGPQGNWIFGI